MPKQTYAIGLLAEGLSVLRLWLNGWRILNYRYRCHAGEIDVIALRRHQLAFIEVKARNSHETAIESISATQQQRIQRAADYWRAQNPKYARVDCQFDVMSVSKWPWPKHIRNVF